MGKSVSEFLEELKDAWWKAALGTGEIGLSFLLLGGGMTDDAFRASLKYATTPQKLDHIFHPKHGLDELVKILGSREKVVERILMEVLQALKGKPYGVYADPGHGPIDIIIENIKVRVIGYYEV